MPTVFPAQLRTAGAYEQVMPISVGVVGVRLTVTGENATPCRIVLEFDHGGKTHSICDIILPTGFEVDENDNLTATRVTPECRPSYMSQLAGQAVTVRMIVEAVQAPFAGAVIGLDAVGWDANGDDI